MSQQFPDDVQFLGRVTFDVIPDAPASQLTPSSVTPNVSNVQGIVKGGGIAVNITNFLGGSDGQALKVLGDGFSTIVHGTSIKTNTGANKLLAVNRMYVFYYSVTDKLWIEH